MKTLISLIIVVISLNCLAEDAVFLEKDQKSPFSGYLLPEETVKNLRNDSLEKDSLKIQLDLTNKNNQLLSQEKQLLLDQNFKLIEAGTKDHNLNTLEKIVYFAAGILTVGLAIKGVQAIR